MSETPKPERAPTYEELREALHKALDHLDYCGWGDSWERECSEGLRTELQDVDDRAYRLPPPDARALVQALIAEAQAHSGEVRIYWQALQMMLGGRLPPPGGAS